MKASLLVSSSSRRRQEDDILVKEPFAPSWIQLEGILGSTDFDFQALLLGYLGDISFLDAIASPHLPLSGQ